MQWYQWSAAVLALIGMMFNLSVVVDQHDHMLNRSSLNVHYVLLFWLPQMWMIGATAARWWQ